MIRRNFTPRRVFRALCPSILSLIILLLIFETSILVIFLSVRRNEESELKIESGLSEYQSLILDTTTNEHIFGIITSRKEIGENEYVFTDHENGRLSLVSNFGINEYHCIGICSCENHSKQHRRSSSVIRTGISYLLVALSSTIAIKLAEEHFRTDCKRKISSNDCPPGLVKSEVEDCIDLSQEEYTISDQKEEEEETSEHDDGNVQVKYWCKGNCLMRYRTFEEYKNYNAMKTEKDYLELKKECENIEQESEVTISKNINPVLIFQIETLHPSCVRASQNDLESNLRALFGISDKTNVNLNLVYDKFDEEKLHTCTGVYENEVNPSVKCRSL